MNSSHSLLSISLIAIVLNSSVPSLGFAMGSLPASIPPTYEEDSATLIGPSHAQAIYQHLLEHHWVPQTGLFLSFYGTGDMKLSQQASTYDQAVIGLLAIRFGDMERAHQIFQFMKEAWDSGPQQQGYRAGAHGLENFYNAEFGGPGIERTIHIGPNAWVGLFAARLGNTTHERESLQLAMDIAYWIAHKVPHQGGGVAMGPLPGMDGIPWPQVYSTENNISYYALLNELLRSSFLSEGERQWITQERQGVEQWLTTQAFDHTAYAMNRGTNPAGEDHIRALDTITWLISAMGPDQLASHHINPERLMAKAEQLFVVHVNGQWGVDSTDQLEADQSGGRVVQNRNRLIWYEGLGQYINALHIMALYAQRTGNSTLAAYYHQKAMAFSQHFDAASLAAYPYGVAYPYATAGAFFHDGWSAPSRGEKGPPSSLVAAAWRCFADLGWDPLSGQNTQEKIPVVQVPSVAATVHETPRILYGTSEAMTTQAWQALNRGDWPLAIEQAQATIQEWFSAAQQLQALKSREIGDVIDYDGSLMQQKRIFHYWALNDVGASYFILGKALDQTHDYGHAALAFQQIVLHYSLAQVWDPKGWFWTPADAVRDEYVYKDPEHYGQVMPQVLAESSYIGKQAN